MAVVATGSGDVKPIGDGLLELRIDWGPGYRVYFARLGATVIRFLRRRQADSRRDIKRGATSRRTSGARPKRADAELSLPYEDWLIEQ